MFDEQTTKINACTHALNQFPRSLRAAVRLAVDGIRPFPAGCFRGVQNTSSRPRRKCLVAGSFAFFTPLLKGVVWFFAFAGAAGVPCCAQNGPTEYQVKAAFIYNFARFVEWPTQSFADASSPMVIGLLGDNPFGKNMDAFIAGKEINGHPLQFKELASPAEAVNCQILFISKSEKSRLPNILAGLSTASVLTVSDLDNFADKGGMIYLFLDDQRRVRFQIDNDTAKKAGLTISSKLLELAVTPH